MSDYICRLQHQFNQEDVKYTLFGKSLCPHCWPNGYMKSKQPQQNMSTEAYNSTLRMSNLPYHTKALQ